MTDVEIPSGRIIQQGPRRRHRRDPEGARRHRRDPEPPMTSLATRDRA